MHALLSIQLPNSTCNLNYTLLIEDGRGIIKRLGPFPHAGSAVVKLDIVISDLKQNKVYSLTAQASLYSQVTLSNKHYFSKAYKYYFNNYLMYNVPYSGETLASIKFGESIVRMH